MKIFLYDQSAIWKNGHSTDVDDLNLDTQIKKIGEKGTFGVNDFVEFIYKHGGAYVGENNIALAVKSNTTPVVVLQPELEATDSKSIIEAGYSMCQVAGDGDLTVHTRQAGFITGVRVAIKEGHIDCKDVWLTIVSTDKTSSVEFDKDGRITSESYAGLGDLEDVLFPEEKWLMRLF